MPASTAASSSVALCRVVATPAIAESPQRIAQGSDVALFLITEAGHYTIVPAPISNEELAALHDLGVVYADLPAPATWGASVSLAQFDAIQLGSDCRVLPALLGSKGVVTSSAFTGRLSSVGCRWEGGKLGEDWWTLDIICENDAVGSNLQFGLH